MTQNATTYFATISYGWYIFIQSLYIPIGIFGIFGNTLVLASYLKYKQLRKLDCAHLIAALSVADLISGYGNVIIGVSRVEIALFNDYDFSRFYCIATAVWVLVGLEMSQALTASIAIDRLIVVTRPFFYRSQNHRTYAIVSVLFSIAFGCGILVLSVVGVDFSTQPLRCTWTSSVHPYSVSIFLIGNALSGSLIIVIYAVVIYKQRKWTAQMAAVEKSSLTSYSTAMQAKMTKMLTKLVIVFFFLIAFPLTALYLAITFKFYPAFTNAVIVTLVNASMSLNSSVNVVIYARSSSSLKPFLFQMLTCGANISQPRTPTQNTRQQGNRVGTADL